MSENGLFPFPAFVRWLRGGVLSVGVCHLSGNMEVSTSKYGNPPLFSLPSYPTLVLYLYHLGLGGAKTISLTSKLINANNITLANLIHLGLSPGGTG